MKKARLSLSWNKLEGSRIEKLKHTPIWRKNKRNVTKYL